MNEKYLEMQKNYTMRELKQLVGCKVKDILFDVDVSEGQGYPGLLFENAKKEQIAVWFLRDEEGNGPGAWDIVTPEIQKQREKEELELREELEKQGIDPDTMFFSPYDD